MPVCKKPLKKSILLQLSVFAVIVSILISVITYTTYSRSIYRSYQKRMADILTYVASHIDDDDLAQCVSTKQKSIKYHELESFMDDVMEQFDVHYVYIVAPFESEEGPKIMDVLTAHTIYERTYEDEAYLTLGYILDEEYTHEDSQLHYDAMMGNEIVFFKVDSAWSVDYTGLLPLIDSQGNHYALLGVDIDISTIRTDIMKYACITLGFALMLGVFYVTILLSWINRNVTQPICQLEQSVVDLAMMSHDQKDPEQIRYNPPDIHTDNEVESLSKAITIMARDIRSYILNIVEQEAKVSDLKSQVNYMDMLAYQDSLTRVKNKAWYDKTKERINEDIENGDARFAIVMMDLNNLKTINDTYGHEHGNDYIYGACHQMCLVYSHSPIFRIGGDEFVVLLEKMDYNNRDALLQQAFAAFEASAADLSKDPWERYSAAIGMAVFEPTTDKTMDAVFKRADKLMYEHKEKTKAARS